MEHCPHRYSRRDVATSLLFAIDVTGSMGSQDNLDDYHR